MKKITVKDILAKKDSGGKIAMITSYDAIYARLADAAGVDMILVGDSVGNTVLGFESTIPVTIDMMLHHTAAVSRANTQALVVADLPFATASLPQAELVQLCARFMRESGAQAVKIEGGKNMAEKVSAIVDAGIPVVGHIGLQPQQVFKLGGYRSFGKTDAEAELLIEDAKALEEAGAFSIVLEAVRPNAAKAVSQSLKRAASIGIGSGPDCDGQVLVITDVLGLSAEAPKFAKKYTEGSSIFTEAIRAYVSEVKEGKFPQVKS